MASAAILRSAARSLRLRQPLEQQRCLLAQRFLSSSVPTERCKSFPSGSHPGNAMVQKKLVNEKKEDIYQRVLRKIDMVSDGLDEHVRLLKQLKAQMEETKKHAGAVNLTPWIVSIPTSFLLVFLYNYMQG